MLVFCNAVTFALGEVARCQVSAEAAESMTHEERQNLIGQLEFSETDVDYSVDYQVTKIDYSMCDDARDEPMAKLVIFPRLKELSLGRSPITMVGFDYIAKLQKLENLSMW
jgi:hypothetical protein